MFKQVLSKLTNVNVSDLAFEGLQSLLVGPDQSLTEVCPVFGGLIAFFRSGEILAKFCIFCMKL